MKRRGSQQEGGAEKRMEPSLLSVGVEPGPKVES